MWTCLSIASFSDSHSLQHQLSFCPSESIQIFQKALFAKFSCFSLIFWVSNEMGIIDFFFFKKTFSLCFLRNRMMKQQILSCKYNQSGDLKREINITFIHLMLNCMKLQVFSLLAQSSLPEKLYRLSERANFMELLLLMNYRNYNVFFISKIWQFPGSSFHITFTEK